MKRKSRSAESEQLVEQVINGIREKKGKEILTMDLRKIENSVCEFFIVCTGDSNTHVDALAGSVELMVKKNLKERPWHIEGMQNSEWVLIDYSNVVVHVFQREAREKYNLEGLWADAVIEEYEEAV